MLWQFIDIIIGNAGNHVDKKKGCKFALINIFLMNLFSWVFKVFLKKVHKKTFILLCIINVFYNCLTYEIFKSKSNKVNFVKIVIYEKHVV